MSFLYPLFLIAGAALLIPIVIHLFNLRRYKTVYFPHTRFLKNIQLRSQKSSQLRYKWLLLLRLLFLASLILAFAQPFFVNKDAARMQDRLQVVYIDNSGSMSLKQGARRLLDIAKDAARQQMQKAPLGTKFLLLTNDRAVSYTPLSAEKAIAALNTIDLAAKHKTTKQVIAQVQGVVQTEAKDGADVYYYSDFQNRDAIPLSAQETEHIKLYGVVVRAADVYNVYIDTAYLTSPVLQAGKSNELVVRTKVYGDVPDELPVLQLAVNGQVKNAASLQIEEEKESIDTLSFQVDNANWQQIALTINDAALPFDDTFLISARSTPNLSVLVLNEQLPSPYLQAAFRAYNGFRLDNRKLNEPISNWKNYNLIILNEVTAINDGLATQLNEAMQAGKSICIFPGRTANYQQLSDGLNKLGDITITGLDTATQTAASIQRGSDLIQDLFEDIPANVQLPTANWHYSIHAGLAANQQSVFNFRNGDPLFARYTPSKAALYISSTGIDLTAGNFQGSYFFVPMLYQMATRAAGGNVYALSLGTQQPAYLPLDNADERNMIHLYSKGVDAIPAQRQEGAGLNVYLDEVVQQAGYYSLSAQGGDTVVVAVNQSRTESDLALTSLSTLKEHWKEGEAVWLTVDSISNMKAGTQYTSFPLWKLCAILAVIMLFVETIVLAGSLRKQSAATQ
ncbi:MAG: BatA domain-containing protein [Flavipsychrobacter sp.]